MSLINVNHFVAPFRSKLQIGAVVVLAVLVAVVRFTGMNSSSNQESFPVPSKQNAMRDSLNRGDESGESDIGQFLKANARSRQALEAREEPNGDEAVDSLLKGGAIPGRRAAPSADDEGAQPGKLNDIKRKLGME